ncbi:multifunctional CCA addition/repair protein [Thiohalobacter sp. IOR34]|uniref:multifunctional CCA addition/repair protein n=1 Tax=Thiohalobacter sp. IOR34 TaxID=3057176 RepID=UPI0025AEE4CC|nr:multifunctional CCA addition/repair protein [Thiohalobacter sp. IOR34]WJW75368.1 multifunctional CCA addition/repair protein [Thiohalobacter sp. IOR34]
METYLVGGAVRDKLLGLPVEERDWVVVGATPEEMLARGFRPVGKDFPVFLHPETGEEYALARTERKSGHGYTGFEFHASPEVTLEEDLRRRDLTINAMAEAADGTLIDPFGGREDLEQGLLRHVSPAFAEDPLRILRVARFAARFAKFGFRIAHGTFALMKRMVENGEVDYLVPERVWKETEKALAGDYPQVYFRVLHRCGALARLFPELERLFGVPQPPHVHPEIDSGLHSLLVLEQAARLSADPRLRFAALTHDLGKGETPAEALPRHPGHDKRGAELVDRLCDRLKTPNDYRQLARLVAAHHMACHRAFELRPSTLLDLLLRIDAFRRPERLDSFLLACHADIRGRSGHEQDPYPQADYVRAAFAAARTVDARSLAAEGLKGAAIGERLRERRIAAIRAVKEKWKEAGNSESRSQNSEARS